MGLFPSAEQEEVAANSSLPSMNLEDVGNVHYMNGLLFVLHWGHTIHVSFNQILNLF